MALANALRRVSDTLISKNGRPATLVHRPAGVSDPDNRVSDAFDVTTGKDASAQLRESVSVILEDGRREENIPSQAGTPGGGMTRSQKATLAAKGLIQAPTERDELKIGAQTWLVVLVETIEHEGLPILYELQIRR